MKDYKLNYIVQNTRIFFQKLVVLLSLSSEIYLVAALTGLNGRIFLCWYLIIMLFLCDMSWNVKIVKFFNKYQSTAEQNVDSVAIITITLTGFYDEINKLKNMKKSNHFGETFISKYKWWTKIRQVCVWYAAGNTNDSGISLDVLSTFHTTKLKIYSAFTGDDT